MFVEIKSADSSGPSPTGKLTVFSEISDVSLALAARHGEEGTLRLLNFLHSPTCEVRDGQKILLRIHQVVKTSLNRHLRTKS